MPDFGTVVGQGPDLAFAVPTVTVLPFSRQVGIWAITGSGFGLGQPDADQK